MALGQRSLLLRSNPRPSSSLLRRIFAGSHLHSSGIGQPCSRCQPILPSGSRYLQNSWLPSEVRATLSDSLAVQRLVPGRGGPSVPMLAIPCRFSPVPCCWPATSTGHAVVRVTAVDDDGQVHFVILHGSVAKNRHLLGHIVA